MTHQHYTQLPGGAMNLLRFQRDPLKHLQWIREAGSDAALIRVPGNHIYFFNTAEATHEVLVKKAAHFDKWEVQKRTLRQMGEYALPNTDGAVWARHRKIMQPAFHTKRIQAYADDMVAQTDALLDTWEIGETRSISDAMKLLTLRIVGRAILGVGISDEEVLTVGQAMNTVQKIVVGRASLPFTIPDWWPGPNNRRFIRAFERITGAVTGVIESRRTSGEDTGDLLSAMILLRESDEQPLTAQELLDEAIALYIGGHETTASTLTWAWYELAANPDAAQKFFAEVDSLEGRVPTVDNLPNVPYVNAVIKETMRRYPSLFFLARTPNQATDVLGYPVRKKGASVFVNVYTIHHDPRYYDQPHAFLPDRWLPDAEGHLLEKTLPRGAYLPFGDGPRICLGNHFASLEMQLILIRIAQRFRLEMVDDAPVEIQAGGTLTPKGGLTMRLAGR